MLIASDQRALWNLYEKKMSVPELLLELKNRNVDLTLDIDLMWQMNFSHIKLEDVEQLCLKEIPKLILYYQVTLS
jgi:hypothetical protein